MSQLKKIGERTLKFSIPPVILDARSIVGPKEGEGPLGDTFDRVIDDMYFGEDS